MSRLLVHPTAPDTEGLIHHITPESAGWRYVGFDVVTLTPGGALTRQGNGNEICIVPLSGMIEVSVMGRNFGKIGGRASPFESVTGAVYVPPATPFRIDAVDKAEVAICASPAKGKYPARLITPDEVAEMSRGTGSNTRYIRNILPDTAEAETLLVVEVVTPGGHWSSYPPHKHDTDDFPNETYLEESYYHRLRRGSGFAVQRVYTKDGTLDETMAVTDRDVVLVPKGYHPVGAPHGFDLYYLNVMAGPVRQWKFSMDPDQAHLPY